MGYLLSIVVPTKDRYPYLEKLVELIISFQTTEIELVIQDNSVDNSTFKEFISLNENQYSWIKYFYEKKYLTSVENFDLAIRRCTGDYVCFIGDDDGVVRNITHYVKWMKDNNVDALRAAHSVYYWTGKGMYTQYATFEPKKNKIQWLSPVHELKKVLETGCLNLGNIPVLYTGIVKRTILDKIFEDIGTYFPGVSPDAANGTVLSFYVNRFACISTPIVITGTSKETGGGMWKRIVHLNEVPFLRKEDFCSWEGTIPPYWTTTLVWPVSVISALRKIDKHDMLLYLDSDKVLSNFYYFNRGYKNVALQYAHSKNRFYRCYYAFYLKSFLNAIVDKSIRVFSRNTHFQGGRIFFNIKDIIEAETLFYSIDKEEA